MSRDNSGRFQPGNTAAKAKRGYKDRGRQLARMFSDGDIKLVYETLMSKASQGDIAALSMIAKYIAPPVKPTLQPVNFCFNHSSPLEAANSILIATASGELPPDVARTLVEAVAATQRIKEIVELEERLKQIENTLEDDQ